jgi:hypothetical protein
MRGTTSLLAVLGVGLVCSHCALADETVNVCGTAPNEVFAHAAVFGINTYENCSAAAGAYLEIKTAGNTVSGSQKATWQATTPAGLLIKDVTIPAFDVSGINDGNQYGGAFYWNGGSQEVHDGGWSAFAGVDDGDAGFPSPYFGLQIVCHANPCTSNGAYFLVEQTQLDVEETVGPTLTAGGLWGQQGWVRGDWPISVTGDSPSGVCAISATVDGQSVAGQFFAQDTSAWHQCDAPGAGGLSGTVHTAQFSDGPHQLSVFGADAAGLNTGSNYATTIYIDNSNPTISLSGPVDAPSTAGTQYVTAMAGGSPSGIGDIVCSVDGGAAQTYPGASAQVPVSGIGAHSISCYSEDTAVDPSGVPGQSAPASWSLRIGEPTVVGIAFDKLVGLRCHRARVRVTIPGRWITVRRHGKRVKIKTPAHTKLERVMRCHPRTVRQRTVVFVHERRHGHVVEVKRIKIVRVVVPPHVIAETSRVVGFGRGTTVNGYLGTASGIAIAGHAVSVLTAPDNGSNQFTQAAVVTTAANGTLKARLPAGPSRIVEAVYGGDPTTEGASSGRVHVVVPAKVKLLSVSPSRVAWGGTVRITGQLLGGYLPAGGALVRLRIGQGPSYQTYGVQEHVTGNGRFTTTYTFGAGYAGILKSFWFQIATLPMGGDYPYSPAASGRRSVVVGLHRPPPPPHSHRPRKHVNR